MNITAEDILDITRSVTKEWTRQRKAEERGQRGKASRIYVYSNRVNFTDVADQILPGAYDHASGNGKYTVAKRQLYYACRDAFREKTSRPLEYNYFAGTLLVQFLNRHPETESWKVTADPRGNLTIPNCGHVVRVPCGTIQIDNHLRAESAIHNPSDVDAEVNIEWPAVAAGQRYQAVLYIEKEGFEPLLEEARIAERYDLAILSCKGQSVVAAQAYVDHVCRINGGLPLYTVHDFDKSGFEIGQRLTKVSEWAEDNDRVTYQFQNEINVTDLGLRLTDVQKYDLAAEDCQFSGGFAADSLTTKAEREFLKSNRRVELNAFTSPQFIEWLEAKLIAHLPERLIPSDDVLDKAYRRALVVARINSAVADVIDEIKEQAGAAMVPKALRRKLAKALKENPQPWDRAVYDLAAESIVDVKNGPVGGQMPTGQVE